MDLKKYYNDPKFNGAFGGKERFYRAVKAKHPNVSRKVVNKYLRGDDGFTLHVPVQKPRKFRRIYTKGIAYCYNLDLIDMTHLAKSNKGYKWIINCIDTFSKKNSF